MIVAHVQELACILTDMHTNDMYTEYHMHIQKMTKFRSKGGRQSKQCFWNNNAMVVWPIMCIYIYMYIYMRISSCICIKKHIKCKHVRLGIIIKHMKCYVNVYIYVHTYILYVYTRTYICTHLYRRMLIVLVSP